MQVSFTWEVNPRVAYSMNEEDCCILETELSRIGSNNGLVWGIIHGF